MTNKAQIIEAGREAYDAVMKSAKPRSPRGKEALRDQAMQAALVAGLRKAAEFCDRTPPGKHIAAGNYRELANELEQP